MNKDIQVTIEKVKPILKIAAPFVGKFAAQTTADYLNNRREARFEKERPIECPPCPEAVYMARQVKKPAMLSSGTILSHLSSGLIGGIITFVGAMWFLRNS
ncbi:MAG: hypothetical protein B6242_06585 [Anaerolineaceae bacterium 4572_78]|nr:MAG: hypothetical protein B6242_06585 [Anaerolineaceae bacterium 4572_78]